MTHLDRYEPVDMPWPDPDGPWLVTVHFARVAGMAECVGLDIRAFRDDGTVLRDSVTPLTASAVRSLPVRRIIDEALRSQEAFSSALADVFAGWDDAVTAARRDVKAYRKRGGKRIEWTPDRLEHAAAVYTAAVETGRPPTRAVAKAFTISPSMAAKVVARCRREGHLPKTTQGRASGRPRDDEGTPE